MTVRISLFLLIVGATLGLPLALAQAKPVKKGALEIELIAEDSAVVPGGKTSVGILLKHDPGWHTYWSHPGIVGMVPKLKWDLPDGVTIAPVQWAMPERTLMGPYKCYGYESDALHIIDLSIGKDIKPGSTLTIKLNVFWLICAEACIVNSADLELNISIVAEYDDVKKTARAGIFKSTRAAWPKAADGWSFEAKEQKDTYTLAFTPPEKTKFKDRDIHFINEGTEVHSDRPQKVEKREDGSYLFTLARFTQMAGKPKRFKGILLNSDGWNADGTLKAIQVDTPLDRSAVLAGEKQTEKKSE